MNPPADASLYHELFQNALNGFYRVPWMWLLLFTAGLTYLLSFLFVQFSIFAARHFDVLARPSERGSHVQPTPRLGGVGAALAFYCGVLAMFWWTRATSLAPWLATALVGGAWATVGGLLDDVLELPPRWKFLFQVAAAGSAVALGFTPASFDVPGLGPAVLPQPAAALFTFAFIIFWMNAYNFMDGMDGQACVFGILVALGFMVPVAALSVPSLSRVLVPFAVAGLIAGSLAGLLWYNHPARPLQMKTFMGDSGSQFFGFLLAVLTLHLADSRSHAGTVYPFGAAMIALSPFAWDVLYTILRRASRGENILQAHRSHLYQRLMIAGWSHGQVLLLNTVLWSGAVLLSWVYALAEQARDSRGQWMIAGAALGWLVAYTLLVLAVEARKRKA